MKIDLLTLFPEMCEAVLNTSIIGRAREKGLVEFSCHQIRDYTLNRQNQVDDSPYGGGEGMLMTAQPIYDCFRAVEKLRGEKLHLIYMTPTGKTLTQERVKELSELSGFAILCGRYEGVDQRVIDAIVDEEISIGDYVVTGGELPALILSDAVSRMISGVLSTQEGYTEESHFNFLLEYPQYTKPAIWNEMSVPEVLVTGHHANIEKWRRQQSLRLTFKRRPELLENANLSLEDEKFLESLKESVGNN
ncbi:MAG: tRNA (guanosine(37)-N1)-methyltransferase TrmD [Clostridiales bacterium]|jgi:tRNA (guanine37-N1)-methyltransferase|nr:tRNA (guanosine(37)-N1)-methyltransferase TrmD [Clostridiales bacterium]